MIRLLLAVALTLLAGTAQAATYYIAPNGSDSSSGTLDRPFRSFAKALPLLRPGDTLFARGGTYVERVKSPTVARGTSSSGITVRAFPGERPVIQGLLWLRGLYYWTLDGINVTWDSSGSAGEHMVKLTNGRGWTLQNSELWGAKSYAVLYIAGDTVGEPSDWRVTNNDIHNNYGSSLHSANQDHLIYCNPDLSGTGGVIERNLLRNASSGHGVKLGGADYDRGGAANVVVRYNTIYNTSMNIMVSGLSENNLIEWNLLGRTRQRSDGSYQYGNIRGNSLTGYGNIARDNAGFESKSMIDNYVGGVGVHDGGGNRWPLDPQFDNTASSDGFRPQNPQAQAYGRFAASTGSDFEPPQVSLTSPAPGAILSGTHVNVGAIATDNVGIARVEFYVDSSSLVGTATSSPYGLILDTTRFADGAHLLTARAFDTAGNGTTSAAVSVTISNQSSGGGSAKTFELAPSADSYVHDGTPTANYGTKPILRTKTAGTGYNRIGYVKMSTSGITTVTSAKLRLYAKVSSGSSSSLSVHSASSAWTELELTWNNRPALGGTLGSASITSAAAFIEVDVTSYVKAQKASGIYDVSFGLKESNGSVVDIDSREGSNDPLLVITGN